MKHEQMRILYHTGGKAVFSVLNGTIVPDSVHSQIHAHVPYTKHLQLREFLKQPTVQTLELGNDIPSYKGKCLRVHLSFVSAHSYLPYGNH